jgi:hypothetical protein
MMIGLANVARRVAKQHEAITVNEGVAPLARWRKSWGLESYVPSLMYPSRTRGALSVCQTHNGER